MTLLDTWVSQLRQEPLESCIRALANAHTDKIPAEEIENASKVIPTSMIASVMLNGILGFSMVIALLFCLGDVAAALATPTGFPFIEVYRNATNSDAGATAMVRRSACGLPASPS